MSYHEKKQMTDLVALALHEDLGRAGDITSQAIFTAADQGRAEMRSRSDGVFSGQQVAQVIATLIDHDLKLDFACEDGACLKAGDLLLKLTGSTRSILALERTLLNFTSHLSGIASLTATFVKLIEGSGARLLCTRKTTPGFRYLEKMAVRHGGGQNHRFGLDDGYLIKDNHIAAAGSVGEAVRRVRDQQHRFIRIEVEIDSIDQIDEAITAGAELLLLDNMPPDGLREALVQVNGRVLTEASGGINLTTARAYAETGVDFLSVGAITQSAPSLDFGLDWAKG